MTQATINQRIKFLVDTLSPSARAFSEAINESPTNTFNYIGGRLVEPRAEYLEKVIRHFGNINAHWLITGEGEPFLSPPTENNLPTVNAKKILRSPIVGTNHGGINQQKQDASAGDTNDDLKNQLTLAQQEIENLRGQLSRADALVAAKDETIALLRASYRNPN